MRTIVRIIIGLQFIIFSFFWAIEPRLFDIVGFSIFVAGLFIATAILWKDE